MYQPSPPSPHFVVDDWVWHGSPLWLDYGWHTLNMFMAACVMCLSFFHARYAYSWRHRCRFLGLGTLGMAFMWGTLFHLSDDLNARTPLYTVAWALAVHGVMVTLTPGSGRR